MANSICRWCGKEFYSRNPGQCCSDRECEKLQYKQYMLDNGYKIDEKGIPNKYTSWGNWECNFTFEGVYNFFFKEDRKEKYGMLTETQPPFQRDLVWSKEQKESWIEHILRGGKTANVIYANCPCWNGDFNKDDKWRMTLQVIDGQQRLSAIKDFVEGNLIVFGEYYYKDINLTTFTSLKINVNDLQTQSEVLKLYLEMNSGGTQHTEDELNKVRKMLEEIK